MANSEAEGFPSGDYNSFLVLNDELFDEKVKELNNGEVIKLYEYIIKENDKKNSIISHERLEELIVKLENMTIIQQYLEGTLDTLEKDYLSDNYSSIDDTVELIIERNNPSLGQRIINYFKE